MLFLHVMNACRIHAVVLTRSLFATVIILLCAVPSSLEAQVVAQVWESDTSWYDEATGTYDPFDISADVSVLNTGADTAYDVRVEIYCPEGLMLDDKLMTRTIDLEDPIAPGDSVVLPLDLKQNIRHSGKLYVPQQLFWLIKWKESAGSAVNTREGHGVVMDLGGCSGERIPNDLRVEAQFPDTLRLNEVSDSTGELLLEIPIRIYSASGSARLLKDFLLDTDGLFAFGARVFYEFTDPMGGFDGIRIGAGDTLLVNCRMWIPVSTLSDFLLFHFETIVYNEDDCTDFLAYAMTETSAVPVIRARLAELAVRFRLDRQKPAGPSMNVNLETWCGSQSVTLLKNAIELHDNGVPMEFAYSGQEFNDEVRAIRLAFALDLSHSMADGAALELTKDLIRQAGGMLDAGRDTLVVYELTDHLEGMREFTGIMSGLADYLDTLTARGGQQIEVGLKEAVLAETRNPHSGSSLMYYLSDGWHQSAQQAQDSASLIASRHSIRLSQAMPTTSALLVRSESYQYPSYLSSSYLLDRIVSERLADQRYRDAGIHYNIHCWSGPEHELSLRLTDGCGKDTTISHTFTVPEERTTPLRVLGEKLQVHAGQPVSVSFRYELAVGESWANSECLLTWDTLVLQLDSIHYAGGSYGDLLNPLEKKGSLFFGIHTNRVPGSGPIGTFHFTALATEDTLETPVTCHVWGRYGNCIVTEAGQAELTVMPVVSSVTSQSLADGFQLLSAYPQPARDQLHLTYQSDVATAVRASIVDILGREVWHGILPASQGRERVHTIALSSKLPSGMYLLRITADGVKGQAGASTVSVTRFQLLHP
ncbi:T9SS type A sorting domain-containing protein [bacterium]|nr:T9SS type A sorting domain-containing protein [bacterium]